MSETLKVCKSCSKERLFMHSDLCPYCGSPKYELVKQYDGDETDPFDI